RPTEGQGDRPRREGGEGEVAQTGGTEGERLRGEGRRRREEGAPADSTGSDVAQPENASRPEGDRPRGEGRRHREGGTENLAQQADGALRPEGGEGRRRREGGASPEGGMARREGGGGGGGRGPQAPAVWPASTAGWNAAFAVAQGVSNAWQSIQFQMPKGGDAVFAISDSHRARPDLRQSVTINLATTAITKTEKFESQSLGRRLRNWVRWIHTGEAGGWLGQLLAGLSTLAAVVLVWTGLALSWRRFFKKKAAKKAQISSSAPDRKEK
ncbi:MAG: PepSY-associated helix domain protein, partial [Akkermansiaceae bacterium]|nr:PepSY-associated helix domain protein [Akkermansiaceae bacterium]